MSDMSEHSHEGVTATSHFSALSAATSPEQFKILFHHFSRFHIFPTPSSCRTCPASSDTLRNTTPLYKRLTTGIPRVSPATCSMLRFDCANSGAFLSRAFAPQTCLDSPNHLCTRTWDSSAQAIKPHPIPSRAPLMAAWLGDMPVEKGWLSASKHLIAWKSPWGSPWAFPRGRASQIEELPRLLCDVTRTCRYDVDHVNVGMVEGLGLGRW